MSQHFMKIPVLIVVLLCSFSLKAQNQKKICGCDVPQRDGAASIYPGIKPCRNRVPYNYGVLDRLVVEKPEAEYSTEAKAAGASGTVTVYVDVNEKGDVQKAVACSGHPMLLKSAVDAAYKAKLKPTLLQGKPLRIEGVMTYKFGKGNK